MIRRPPRSTPFPTRRSSDLTEGLRPPALLSLVRIRQGQARRQQRLLLHSGREGSRSEEHTSELQSRQYLVCRLLLEKKKVHTVFISRHAHQKYHTSASCVKK